MRLKLVLIGFVCLALTACGAPHASATDSATTAGVGTFQQAPCPVELPDEIEEGASLKRPKDIVCGYVTVPEEHDRLGEAESGLRTIRLAVAVIKATGDAPAPDPLVLSLIHISEPTRPY